VSDLNLGFLDGDQIKSPWYFSPCLLGAGKISPIILHVCLGEESIYHIYPLLDSHNQIIVRRFNTSIYLKNFYFAITGRLFTNRTKLKKSQV